VHGITVLARDVTALRRNEARFTELFESLQEGIYIVTTGRPHRDANPRLSHPCYDRGRTARAGKSRTFLPTKALRNIVAPKSIASRSSKAAKSP